MLFSIAQIDARSIDLLFLIERFDDESSLCDCFGKLEWQECR